MQSSRAITSDKNMAMQQVKVQGRRDQRKLSSNLGISGSKLHFEYMDGTIDAQSLNHNTEAPHIFSRWSAKYQGNTGRHITNLKSNCACPGCNSSFNPRRVTKWCTEVKVAHGRCPIFYRGHPSNDKVTRAAKSSIWLRFERLRVVSPRIHGYLLYDAHSLNEVS